MDDPLSHLIDGGLSTVRDARYFLERELGRGSMGVVYAARDAVLDRPVAIKVMAATMASDSGLRRYFEREARAAGRLSHRNIVTVHDFGYDAHGAPFVVMELLRGRDLRQALSADALTLEQRLAVVLQVLAGLAHAHAAGIVHRDVKPANVFLTEQGVVKLLDFGIARLYRGTSGNSSDAVMGTADYMAPEQVLSSDVDGRSDLFSCGSMLYELLAGKPPFHAESFVTIAYRVVHDEPDYGALPLSCAALEPVLRTVLAKRREARYASALDFATELGLAMGVGVAPDTIQQPPEMAVTTSAPAGPEIAVTVDLRERWHEAPSWPQTRAADEAGRRAAAPVTRARRAPLRALAWVAGLAVALGAAGWLSASRVSSPANVPHRSMEPSTVVPVMAPANPDASKALAAPAAAAGQPFAKGPQAARSGQGFWNVVPPPSTMAIGPAVPAATPVLTREASTNAPPRLQVGRWTGHLTDDLCREKGAVSDHGRCLEVCLRRGQRPLILIDGRLYRLTGIERVRGLHDRRVVVEGELDPGTRTLTVTAGWPAPR